MDCLDLFWSENFLTPSLHLNTTLTQAPRQESLGGGIYSDTPSIIMKSVSEHASLTAFAV